MCLTNRLPVQCYVGTLKPTQETTSRKVVNQIQWFQDNVPDLYELERSRIKLLLTLSRVKWQLLRAQDPDDCHMTGFWYVSGISEMSGRDRSNGWQVWTFLEFVATLWLQSYDWRRLYSLHNNIPFDRIKCTCTDGHKPPGLKKLGWMVQNNCSSSGGHLRRNPTSQSVLIDSCIKHNITCFQPTI